MAYKSQSNEKQQSNQTNGKQAYELYHGNNDHNRIYLAHLWTTSKKLMTKFIET